MQGMRTDHRKKESVWNGVNRLNGDGMRGKGGAPRRLAGGLPSRLLEGPNYELGLIAVGFYFSSGCLASCSSIILRTW